MALVDPIRVDGLRQFTRDLRRIDNDLPKALRVSFNRAAQLVVDYAQPKVPRRSGRASKSVKTRSTRSAVRVAAGGPRVPYFPWLDFGGRVGPARSVRRPYRKEGRYLWAGYAARRDQVAKVLDEELRRVASSTGWDVE